MSWNAAVETRLSQLLFDERTAEADRDKQALNGMAGEFYVRMSEFAGNALLSQYIPDLILRVSLILAKHDEPLISMFTIQDQEKLLASLRNRDLKGSERLIDLFLAGAEHRALAGYQRPEPPTLRSALSTPG